MQFLYILLRKPNSTPVPKCKELHNNEIFKMVSVSPAVKNCSKQMNDAEIESQGLRYGFVDKSKQVGTIKTWVVDPCINR